MKEFCKCKFEPYQMIEVEDMVSMLHGRCGKEIRIRDHMDRQVCLEVKVCLN